jgi:hypothetical protein
MLRRSLLNRLLRRPWPPIDVLLVTAKPCPLCEEAAQDLRRVAGRLGLRIRIADITDFPDLRDLYGNHVPVVYVAGRLRFFGHVDLSLLKRDLQALRSV